MFAPIISLFALLPIITSAHSGHDPGHMVHLIFQGGTVHAHVQWETGPRTPDESILRIEWKNGRDHTPITAPGEFKVELWMPDMGHGSAPTTVTPIMDTDGNPVLGAYRVSNVYFTMGGAWDVRVILNLPDGTSETQTLKVKLDGEHNH